MSAAPVTEAHRKLAVELILGLPSRSCESASVHGAAQLIADSEARAVDHTWRAERDELRAQVFNLEAEVATLTAERDHWQKIAVSASHEREHNANVAQAITAERDLLRACLRDLVDEQNGAPLELRRTQWQAAMDEALSALTKTEDAT